MISKAETVEENTTVDSRGRTNFEEEVFIKDNTMF